MGLFSPSPFGSRMVAIRGWGLLLKHPNNFPATLDVTVIGSLLNCVSNDDLSPFFSFIRSAYKTSDGPDFSFVNTICLFERKRSFTVRTSRSMFPLWSRTGQVMCFMHNCLQNFKTSSLANTDRKSVLFAAFWRPRQRIRHYAYQLFPRKILV